MYGFIFGILRLLSARLKRTWVMKYCKIKLFGFLLAFAVCFAAHSAVQVEELAGDALDTVGLEKTLPFTAWGDIPFDHLRDMTLSLSAQKQSAALTDLTVRVLTQPTFITAGSWTKAQSEEWLKTRLRALLNMGQADLVLAMIKKLPAGFVSTDILKIKMDALFLLDDWQGACVIAVQNADKDAYLNKAQMLCLGLMGDKDKAMLAFDMWQEEHPQKNISAFVMGQLMDMPVKAPDKDDALTIADTYVLLQLKSPFLENAVFPLAYQRQNRRHFSGFGTAINATKLLEVWQKAGLDSETQAYRFYLVATYADLFLPDLRFIRRSALWAQPMTKQNFSPRAVFLKDKPESQITGGDLLLGLWLISQQAVDINRAFLLLGKGGLELENFVLEQMNP